MTGAYFFDDLEPFHPAQHFSDETAYFGVCLEADVVVKKTTRRQPVLAFITSKRELLDADHDALRERGLRYAGEFPGPPDPRYRPSAVKEWWRGEETKPNVRTLYERIREAFAARVEFPSEAVADVCALFTIGTYVHRLFDTYPYLEFRGSKASGKTKTAKLVGSLAFNAVEATALTGGALYLEVEAHGATLLLDDAEDLGDDEARAVKAMLNVGYKAGGNTIRGSWEQQSARRYSVFSPKVITTIRGVNDTLASRCITIRMQPSIDAKLRDRGEDPTSAEWPVLRDFLYVWALSHWTEVRQAYRETQRADVGLGSLSGRAWELWRPLVALAIYFEAQGVEGLVGRVAALAQDSQAEARSEEADTREGVVLSFLIGRNRGAEHVDILPKKLTEDLEEEVGERISTRSLGWLLKRLGLDRYKSRATETGGRRYRVPMAALEDAALRRGIDASTRPGKTPITSETSETPAVSPVPTDVTDISDVHDVLSGTLETNKTPTEEHFGPRAECACGAPTMFYAGGNPLCPKCKAGVAS